MATKAELEAELISLKHELKGRETPSESRDDAPEDPVAEDGSSQVVRLKDALKGHGIDADDLGAVGERLVQELSQLQKEKPIVVLIAAFALGCIVGRASK